MLTGKLLVAPPMLDDPNFERAVVHVLAHGDEGALGVVLNRPTRLPLDALPVAISHWNESIAPPHYVFEGGPVAPGTLIALGRSGREILPVDLEDSSTDDWEAVRIFRGYSGWSAGQLDMEIAAGGWWICEVEPDDPFTSDPEFLWRVVVARQSGEIRRLSTFPDDPEMN